MELTAIEAYYDIVPRAAAVTEEVGPFTLFLAAPGTTWNFYARPRLGLADEVTVDDVRRVLARQDELGVPRAIEWVDETTPSLLPAVRAALPDAGVELCPLLVLPATAVATAPAPGRHVAVTADAPDLDLVLGAIDAGFGERDDITEHESGRRVELIRAGLLVVVAGYDDDGAVVGGGSASPRGATAELMGISVIPRARRRGHGSAITAALVDAVRHQGVSRPFLSAASDDAASIYRAVGFERIATACILELPRPTE